MALGKLLFFPLSIFLLFILFHFTSSLYEILMVFSGRNLHLSIQYDNSESIQLCSDAVFCNKMCVK